MNLSMKALKSEDVDNLHGLTLSIAFAIYVEGWQWYNFPGSDTPWLLLDAPMPANKTPDKDCARYIGDEHWVFEDLMKYHESLYRMLYHGKKLIDAGYAWDYTRYIEEEIGSAEHWKFLHCGAEIRCRAILKLHLDNPNIREELKKDEEE